MKKYLFTFIINLIATVGLSQHISFLGIQLGNDILVFKKSLVKKGFQSIHQTDSNIYPMVGMFNGYKATLSILTTPKSKKVYEVFVSFDDFLCGIYDENMKTLQISTYRRFCNQLNRRYGSGEECNYGIYIASCSWHTPNGRIILGIDTLNPYYRRLGVSYSDTQTDKIANAEEQSDW